jgi:peptidoglycan hydrolase CwlO-like protein
MNKSTQILIYLVLGIVTFHTGYNLFFTHSKLSDALDEIKNVKADLNRVSDSLSFARGRIGEVLQNLNENEARVNLMKSEVEVLYLDYHNDEAKSKIKRDSIKTELGKEEQNIDDLKNELDKIDN